MLREAGSCQRTHPGASQMSSRCQDNVQELWGATRGGGQVPALACQPVRTRVAHEGGQRQLRSSQRGTKSGQQGLRQPGVSVSPAGYAAHRVGPGPSARQSKFFASNESRSSRRTHPHHDRIARPMGDSRLRVWSPSTAQLYTTRGLGGARWARSWACVGRVVAVWRVARQPHTGFRHYLCTIYAHFDLKTSPPDPRKATLLIQNFIL